MISLTSRRAFTRVSREGRRWTKRFMQLRALNNSLETNRIGIVVSEKAVSGAVDRNRVKRLVSEAYRLMQDNLAVGYDLVFIIKAKPETNHLDYVSDIMRDLFCEAGFLI